MSLGAVAVVGGIVGALALMQPVLHGLGNYNLLIFFVGLVGLMVFAGVPIAFSFGLATFGYLALTTQHADRSSSSAAWTRACRT